MKLISHLSVKAETLPSQFIRYFIVGCIAFIVDFTLLYLFTEFARFYYLLSATISFMAGIAVNYSLSVSWVFNHRSIDNMMQEFAIFTIVGIVGLALNDALMWVFTELLGLHYLESKVVAAASIFVFNFIVRKVLLFSGNQPSEQVLH